MGKRTPRHNGSDVLQECKGNFIQLTGIKQKLRLEDLFHMGDCRLFSMYNFK